jgi:hypothetical protein
MSVTSRISRSLCVMRMTALPSPRRALRIRKRWTTSDGRSLAGAPEGLVDGQVHALDHRGQHRPGLEVVLVAVDADGQAPPVPGRLEHAESRRAGGRIDHVGAAVELAPGQLASPGGVVPGCRRRARHVLEDLDPGIDVACPLLVAEGELADQRDVHAADEADLARPRGHRGRHADEERPLVLLEDDRLDVGQGHDPVDDDELQIGELTGHLLHAGRLREADPHDDVGPPAGHGAERLLALGLGSHLELATGDPGLLPEALGPVQAASLKDRSNFPPMSKTTAGTKSWAGAGRARIPRARTATARARTFVMDLPPS